MYCIDDLTQRESRKFSTNTASTCLEPWPHKLSLTPSLDGPYPPKFSPSSEDIKYLPIVKPDADKKIISPKILLTNSDGLDEDTQKRECNPAAQSENSTKNREIETDSVEIGQQSLSEQRHRTKQQNSEETDNEDDNSISAHSKSQRDFNENKPNETVLQRPRPTKRSSCESLGGDRTVGIGGRSLYLGDSTRHIGIIDVNTRL